MTTQRPGAAIIASIRRSCPASCSAIATIEPSSLDLLDIAPTVLEVFGVPAPEYMDGRVLSIGETASQRPANDDARTQPYSSQVA